MITARWQFACDPVRRPVLSPSGVTCRETSVTVRFYDATFSPGCACKQPAVPYWSSTRPLASVTYFHLPFQYCGLSVGDRDTACLTDGSVLFDRSFVIPGYAMRRDTGEDPPRGRDTLCPIDPRYLSIIRFSRSFTSCPSRARTAGFAGWPVSARWCRSPTALVILVRVNCFLGLSILLISRKQIWEVYVEFIYIYLFRYFDGEMEVDRNELNYIS